jgi:hypothetical protein
MELAIKVMNKVKPLSSNRRFLIALAAICALDGQKEVTWGWGASIPIIVFAC